MTIEAAYNTEQFGRNADYKRDTISEDERALIDAAIAAGKVQKIPTGQSAFEINYRWDGRQLASIESEGWRAATSRKKAKIRAKQEINQAAKAKREAIAKRREVVREMSAAGKSINQIAAHLGVERSVVKNDRVAIRRAAA